MRTPEGFRSLAGLLRSNESPQPEIHVPDPETPAQPQELDAARDVLLFRARIAEAVDCAVATLCQDIAAEVVARELQLAPAELGAIVKRAVQRYASESVVRVRVHPDDAGALLDGPVCLDPSLRRGDAVLDVASGSIDASLGVRLDSVLRAFR